MAERQRSNPATKKKPAQQAQTAPDTPEPKPIEEAVEDAEQVQNSNGKAAKEPSLYHVYVTDNEGQTLTWIADRTVKTGDVAVSELVAADESLVGKELVVVPDRNYKVYKTEVKTTTRVKVTAA